MKRDNLTTILAEFTKKINIPISAERISEELLIHPDFPSLLAMSDVLSSMNIPNKSFYAEPNELQDIPCPFIVHNKFNSAFLLVSKIEGEQVLIFDEKRKYFNISKKELEIFFNGVVFTAEPSTLVNRNYSGIRNFVQMPLIITLLFLMLIAALASDTRYFENVNWMLLMLTLFKGAGIITSVLLLLQSVDSNNNLIQKICKGGKKTDCNAILSSSAATVFKGLSWSEVGFYYFTATGILTLFCDPSKYIQTLLYLNIVSLPYTFYSIYFQARIVKKWCVLCCTIQVLLWLEFIPLLLLTRSPLKLPLFHDSINVIIAFLLPVISWTLLKPIILIAELVAPMRLQLQQSKYNSTLFNNLLHSKPKYSQPKDEWSIVIGNSKPTHIITMVSNPYCQPCAEAHKRLEKLLEQRKDLQARIVFTAENSEHDIKTPVSRHLMSLNNLNDKSIVKGALSDWYERGQKDYHDWSKSYPLEQNPANNYQLDQQREWCKIAQITSTPTLLINGRLLPNLYQLSDLKYILELAD